MSDLISEIKDLIALGVDPTVAANTVYAERARRAQGRYVFLIDLYSTISFNTCFYSQKCRQLTIVKAVLQRPEMDQLSGTDCQLELITSTSGLLKVRFQQLLSIRDSLILYTSRI